jgi:hypothetical protein
MSLAGARDDRVVLWSSFIFVEFLLHFVPAHPTPRRYPSATYSGARAFRLDPTPRASSTTTLKRPRKVRKHPTRPWHNPLDDKEMHHDSMYGPAVCCKRFRCSVFGSCINVSGLCLELPAPGHHGYQRALDLITTQASLGPFESPVFDRAGKTGLHRIFNLSQTSAGISTPLNH